MKKRLLFLLTVIVLVSMVVMGCGGATEAKRNGTDANTEKQEEVVQGSVMVYSSLKDTQLAALQEGFMNKYPHITMDFYTAGTGNVMTKLAAEQQAGGISADLIWVGDPTNYIDFKERGLLLAYDSPAAKNIPDRFKDSDSMYISGRLIMLGFVYNTLLLDKDQAPMTWEDLLKPEFKDNVTMTDPTTSGTTLYTVAGLTQNPKYGWEYFEKLKANGTKLESGSSAVVNKVGAGEYLVSVGVDYIARSLIAQGSPIGFIYPDNDIPIIESPIAIIKNTKNVEAAKLLYDYIITEGQEVLLEEYTVPINPDLTLEGALPVQEASKRMLAVDNNKLVDEKAKLLETFDNIFK
jgi:iron(III) transport system substrate-binding protein